MRRGLWACAITITSFAAGSSSPQALAAGPTPPASARVSVDPGTGLEVRIARTAARHVTVEIGSQAVSIKKNIGGGRSVTTIVTPAETVIVTVASGRLSIAVPPHRMVLTGIAPETVGRTIAFMKQSPAIRAARALLARTRLAPHSIEGRALQLTRMVLESGGPNILSLAGSSSSTRGAAVLARTTGPAISCWDTYVKTADALMEALKYCLTHPSWWNPFPQETCELEYGIKAEAALVEWVACEGAQIVG